MDPHCFIGGCGLCFLGGVSAAVACAKSYVLGIPWYNSIPEMIGMLVCVSLGILLLWIAHDPQFHLSRLPDVHLSSIAS